MKDLMDETWQYYEIFTNVLDTAPARAHGLTPVGLARMERVERALGAFYTRHRSRITGIYIFHYYDVSDGYRGAAAEDTIRLPPGVAVEFLRLRFRVGADDAGWAPTALRREVLTDPALGDAIRGWREVEGYTARADVGARFGDLEHGVDPTESVVKILTGNTELRFYLLDHPGFVPNHDIIHLYFNTLGLFYPEEVAALEARARKVRGFLGAT